MKKLTQYLILPFLLISTSVTANSVMDVPEDAKALRSILSKTMPAVKINKISKSHIDGLYEVVSGSQVVYISKDGKYMIDGDFVDLVNKRNYTEESKSGMRLAKINTLDESLMLVYEPKEVKHTVTVFTDIDCPYCRRLHDEMGRYMDLGVKVRYVFMPLKGKADFATTVSVWCSEDRNLSLDIAKAGGSVESKTCDNPIKRHLSLGREIGVRGTPAIVMEDGTLLPGYVEIDKLIVELRKI